MGNESSCCNGMSLGLECAQALPSSVLQDTRLACEVGVGGAPADWHCLLVSKDDQLMDVWTPSSWKEAVSWTPPDKACPSSFSSNHAVAKFDFTLADLPKDTYALFFVATMAVHHSFREVHTCHATLLALDDNQREKTLATFRRYRLPHGTACAVLALFYGPEVGSEVTATQDGTEKVLGRVYLRQWWLQALGHVYHVYDVTHPLDGLAPQLCDWLRALTPTLERDVDDTPRLMPGLHDSLGEGLPPGVSKDTGVFADDSWLPAAPKDQESQLYDVLKTVRSPVKLRPEVLQREVI